VPRFYLAIVVVVVVVVLRDIGVTGSGRKTSRRFGLPNASTSLPV
jgi:hypothetical protein